MSYNTLKDVYEAINYLQEASGFYYLQDPTTWQNCFQQIANSAPKLTNLIGGEASAEIVDISSVYNSVGKSVYATAESGLKSAPVIEGVFTQAEQETAEIGASALGTYVAGVSVGLPLATAVIGILGGLGIGILGYETAPEGWVDISNAIFGTDIGYESAKPLIRSYVQTMLSKNYDPTSDKGFMMMSSTYLERAYNYFARHMIGGINYDFLENTDWQGTTQHPNIPTECTPATQHYLQDLNLPITGDLTQEWINYLIGVWKEACERFHVELPVPDFKYSDILSEIYELVPNYRNANLFTVQCTYFWVAGASTVPFQILINGFRVPEGVLEDVDVNPTRQLTFGFTSGYGYRDSDFCYTTNLTKSDNCVFSYMRDFQTGVGTARDDGQSIAGEYSTYVTVGVNGTATSTDVRKEIVCQMWNVGSTTSMTEELDAELISKGFINNPKYAPDVDEAKVKKPTRKTNFQDQYAYWYGGKKRVGQPNKNGEPEIITYIPVPVPASIPSPQEALDKGLGVQNDPYSFPVAPPEALPDYQPAPLSPTAPLTDPTQNIVNIYNESRVTPDTTPEPIPETQPNPQYPEKPPTDPTGDTGDTPLPTEIGGITASGMVSVYNPTKQQLKDFSAWLWSSTFDLDTFKKLFTNPMDCIIGIHIMYSTPITGGTDTIKTGNVDSGVSSKVVSQQYSKLNCGTITLPEYYGNATDYEPYTQVHIYLPFIGIVPLKANDVLGKQLNVEYGIDVLTGTCLAMLTTMKDGAKILCYTFAGNCAVQIPISGGNYANILRGLIGLVGGIGVAVVTKNPAIAVGGVAGGVSSLLSSSVNVQHSGGIGSNAGACGVRKPYVMITRKKSYDAQNYPHYYGLPANAHVTLSSCKGYTQVKSCHVESVYNATDNEKQEIESLLKEGVIII